MAVGDTGDPLLKLLLIGESSVGKSCILLRYAENKFQESFFTTVGIDFKVRQCVLSGRRVRLQVWDTAGQEKFRTITKAYYRGAHGILLVFDVSNADTFAQCQGWMNSIRENITDPVSIALVGNKCDLDRMVSVDQAEAFAREYGVQYFETSAKTGLNVESTIMTVAKMAIDNNQMTRDATESRSVRLSSVTAMRKQKSKGCC
jgi:small GTP-binding protein